MIDLLRKIFRRKKRLHVEYSKELSNYVLISAQDEILYIGSENKCIAYLDNFTLENRNDKIGRV